MKADKVRSFRKSSRPDKADKSNAKGPKSTVKSKIINFNQIPNVHGGKITDYFTKQLRGNHTNLHPPNMPNKHHLMTDHHPAKDNNL